MSDAEGVRLRLHFVRLCNHFSVNANLSISFWSASQYYVQEYIYIPVGPVGRQHFIHQQPEYEKRQSLSNGVNAIFNAQNRSLLPI